MAVKDESLHHATEDLILPKPRKYYQAAIYNSHWQLRSLIASPEPHIIYYPTSNDIVALNTKTRERETITSIPFPPRCLTACKDWVCIGGEQGNYAAISLGDKRERLALDLDADDRLPLDLDPAHRRILREAQYHLRRYTETSRRPDVKVLKVGTEIVNCITIWSPGEDATNKAYRAAVAVVSNNDCTVSILDLKSSEVLQQLVLPDYVNRSVIAPDGSLLATISDDPYLYLHERQKKDEKSDDYEWTLMCKIQLEGQRPAEKSEMRGSFAACFSRSGKYLAVATQYGVISVFDVETIDEPKSLVSTFTTSRPSEERDCGGAVRAMEFSPGIIDLLAWTESTGRAGIADVRTLFFSRQLLKLDPYADTVERVHITDKTSDPVIDPRLRAQRSESPLGNINPSDIFSSDLDRRRLRPTIREFADRHPGDPTPEELEILHAHRIARRQRDVANGREDAGEASNTSMWASDEPEDEIRRLSSSGLPAALRDFINTDRSTASFRSFINERNLDRERRRQQQEQESRRRSAILTAAENAIERETLGTSMARDGNDNSSALDRLTLTPRQATSSDSPSNPWAEIDALYRSRYPGDPPPDRTTRLRIELDDDDRRDFAHRLRQPWRPLDDSGRINLTAQERQVLMSVGTPLHRSVTVETMGCCWSEDGRILYVGGSNGIYEYHVNVAGRKMHPSLVLR